MTNQLRSSVNRRRDFTDKYKWKKQRIIQSAEEEIESKFGFNLFSEGDKRLGWLLTFTPSSCKDEDTEKVYSCIDLYFVTQDGSSFKSKYKFRPYFYAATKDKMETDVEDCLRRRYKGQIADIEILEKEDLDLSNHLSGLHKAYLKLSFDAVQELMNVKSELLHVVESNREKSDAAEAYDSILFGKREQRSQDFLECIVDLREYDVPYHVRFAIDHDLRCGQWYDVSVSSTGITLEKRNDLLQRAEVRICAFDLETTKLPLKFPDAEYDMIMMISYMVDGQGYLIINRECVGEDIENLEYTPKPEYEGFFKVSNVKNELELLKLWFAHMRELKPGIYVTYNGDYFDWPFLESRTANHGLKMSDEVGFQCDKNQGECRSKFACHLDCFAWVKRDSYLPQGSHGLKAVTKAKLGYDPLEVNPEDMVRFAKEKPQMMASYSVSDAVATYYLYMTYVHPFIFSLATIIPMSPDEVLRKGSGTLCEMLLMVQAYKANVVCPNKHQSDPEKFHNNRLLESETYIGGHVECLESGVFRSDLPTRFRLDSSAYDQLINNLDRDLQYAIQVEGKMDLESVSNYSDVKNAIMEKLIRLRDEPMREECPLIYHLDVAAMYPNIILTNRLQPPSVVTDEVCTACDFNRPGKTCLRKLKWVWRGEVFMAKRSDYYHLKRQIESEFVNSGNVRVSKQFLELPKLEQQAKLKERLKKYCQKAYKRVLDPVTEVQEAGICMRENSFYIDTVRSFRDRRYEYKGLNKVWKGKLSEAKASGNSIKIQEAQDMVVLYDSLQLAHKCILNSFYGYVMRKGARWYSMEMAGVVTYTGAKIIQNAHLLIKKIGKPLELDTDGIWCALPGSFPENFTFETKDLKKLTISYPCVMLNVDVAKNNTNDQYQTLVDPVRKIYETRSECSIEFEVDGPYKAMILPASKEEGILIKKRYAVFNDDGTLAELKGFEIKRRGELKLIKVFQAELFDKFLHGSTLEECYSVVASVANRWLDLLDSQGKDIADSELLDYISESSTMSKSLADYGEQKSCAVTTAKRLADFLGDTMVRDKGLRCQYIVACEPKGTPVSERAVPVAIFETDQEIMKFYVRKWCKISSEVGIRSIIDWSYYKQRLSSAIQKIITIPAAMQKVSNPVPRVVHPDWLHKKVREKDDKFCQPKIVDMFASSRGKYSENNGGASSSKHVMNSENSDDIEDFQKKTSATNVPKPVVRSYNVTAMKHSVTKDSQVDSMMQEKCKGVGCDPSSPLHFKDIDRNVDYHGWLEMKKRKWRNILDKRKKQRLVDLRTPLPANGVPLELNYAMNNKEALGITGVGLYFKRHEKSITHCHWQILQLVHSSQSGQYFAWAVVEGVMLKIPITVPRVFYINSKLPITEGFVGRRVNKTLPHGTHIYNLYEVVTDEGEFRTQSNKLAALLADPEVEGIYESKVSLEFKSILQIGCVCKVDKTAKKRNIQDGWSLDELQMKTTTECSYLEKLTSFFYVYNSISEGGDIYITYFPATKFILVVVVTSYRNKDLSSNFLERKFCEACQMLSGQSQPPKSGIAYKVDYVVNIKEAEVILQKSITEYRSTNLGPTVAIIESPNVQLLKSVVKVLDDFPCLNIPYDAHHSQYQFLGWQQKAAEIGMRQCANSSRWLNNRISLARYAHVPLGNIEPDWKIFTADIFFSRALHDQQQVLWISDDGVPDIGGNNFEDVCLVDEVQQPIRNCSGAYRKFSVELKIHHLAVNALLKSNQVNEMEGGGFDEAESYAPAFPVLKQLIQRCLADVATSGNVYADEILLHLYRWICSPQSRLHDPALHRLLHKAMQKVFALLLAALRKLGATIIFANFSKVVIDTGKSDLSAAKAYCDSLLKTLQTRDLFEWIELIPVQFWHSLLFMDQYNYGGISAKDNEITDAKSQVKILSNWKIAEYLPKKIQDCFITIISQFIYIPWIFATKQAVARVSLQQADTCTPSFESQVTEHLKEQLSSYFSNHLFGIVDDILHKQPSDSVHKEDAALKFINYVCAALELDQNVRDDVRKMKKNLLKYMHVKEFAPEAQFSYPCTSFILPNVFCSYCNDCRDLDLCRDSDLQAQEWRCGVAECGQPYNQELIENALIQIVMQRERAYHVQDLVCGRCKQVKAAHLWEQCACAGTFQCKEDAKEFLSSMRILLEVATRQKFQLLEELISTILLND